MLIFVYYEWGPNSYFCTCIQVGYIEDLCDRWYLDRDMTEKCDKIILIFTRQRGQQLKTMYREVAQINQWMNTGVSAGLLYIYLWKFLCWVKTPTKITWGSLSCLAQWLKHWLEDCRIPHSILVKGTNLGYRLVAQPLLVQKATNQWVSLTLMFLSVYLSLLSFYSF